MSLVSRCACNTAATCDLSLCVRVCGSNVQPGYVRLALEKVSVTFKNQEVLKDASWQARAVPLPRHPVSFCLAAVRLPCVALAALHLLPPPPHPPAPPAPRAQRTHARDEGSGGIFSAPSQRARSCSRQIFTPKAGAQVQTGDRVGLVGANGGGKTTQVSRQKGLLAACLPAASARSSVPKGLGVKRVGFAAI